MVVGLVLAAMAYQICSGYPDRAVDIGSGQAGVYAIAGVEYELRVHCLKHELDN